MYHIVYHIMCDPMYHTSCHKIFDVTLSMLLVCHMLWHIEKTVMLVLSMWHMAISAFLMWHMRLFAYLMCHIMIYVPHHDETKSRGATRAAGHLSFVVFCSSLHQGGKECASNALLLFFTA